MLPPFAYLKPRSLEEVGVLLKEHGERARILAGGTDLLVGMRQGVEIPSLLIDIKAIPDLRNLSLSNGTLSIGAAVRVGEVLESKTVAEHFPILIQAALSLGSHQIRNRATVVGNLCNASPAADMATPLLVLGTRVSVASSNGKRMLPLEEFFTGVKKSALGRDEWVVSVEVDLPPRGTRMGFVKHARVRGPDLSTVNCAALLTPEGELSLALGAVAEAPVKVSGLKTLEKDAVLDRVRKAMAPIDDVRSSAEYRTDVTCFLVTQLLNRLAGNS